MHFVNDNSSLNSSLVMFKFVMCNCVCLYFFKFFRFKHILNNLLKLRCLEGLCNRLTYSIERVITNIVR